MKRDLAEILGPSCPSLRVCDVGAMDLGEGSPFEPLLSLPGSELVGFEPNREECEKLAKSAPPGRSYHPYFIGDGTEKTFRFCAWNATSSLYEPNAPLLSHFNDLPGLLAVKERVAVKTTRLDDVEGLGRVDFLKIDVQGATLDVLRGAEKTLESCVVVQCEAEFVPLYEGEPLFAEIDLEMRRRGFLLHRFLFLAERTFAPLQRPKGMPGGQLLWTDAIYTKSFLDLARLAPEQLLRLALICERQLQSPDLSLVALKHHDAKQKTSLYSEYLASLTGG